jgi:thioesterase superfamily protein 4
MDDTIIAELSSTPWAAALINDRKWTAITTNSRSPKPTGEDSFFAETLSTDRTIRSLLTFRPTQEEDDDLAYKEIKTIVDLGVGLNGYPQIVHGGFAATLLDEVCGILVMLVRKVQGQRELGQTVARPNYFTACR